MEDESRIHVLQKQFDNNVQDNIMKYEMTPESSISKAITDWPSQDRKFLRYIIGDKFFMLSKYNNIMEKLTKLKNCVMENDFNSIGEIIDVLKDECADNVTCVFLIQKECDHVLLDALQRNEDSDEIRISILEMLVKLTSGNIPFLSRNGVDTVVSLLRPQFDTDTQLLVFNLCIRCSIADESIIPLMVNSNIMSHIETILQESKLNENLLLKVCELIKVVVSLDKINPECLFQAYYVTYHVSDDIINGLVHNLKEYKGNRKVVKKLLNTLAMIITKNSLCKHFLNTGGLHLNSEILHSYVEEEEMVFHSFRLLKTIAQSDNVRDEVMNHISPPTVVSTVRKFYNSERVSRMGMAFMVALTLRHGANGKALCEHGLIETLKLCMSSHPKSKLHLKRGCWLIYNIISRNRELREEFLKNEILDTIRTMLVWVTNCHFECQTALIQLGYHIEYIEQLFEETANAVSNLNECKISEKNDHEAEQLRV